MKHTASSARNVILLLAILVLALYPGIPTHAEDRSVASQIAELMFSDEYLLSVQKAAPDAELRLQQRKALSERLDVSSISDRDLDTFTRISLEINAEGLAAGLRRALANRLEDIRPKDQQNMLRCFRDSLCDRSSLSDETKAFLETFPKYIGQKAKEITMIIGAANGQRLLEKLNGMDASEFDDRDELIRVMTGPLK